jgi:hypothetical protein
MIKKAISTKMASFMAIGRKIVLAISPAHPLLKRICHAIKNNTNAHERVIMLLSF